MGFLKDILTFIVLSFLNRNLAAIVPSLFHPSRTLQPRSLHLSSKQKNHFMQLSEMDTFCSRIHYMKERWCSLMLKMGENWVANFLSSQSTHINIRIAWKEQRPPHTWFVSLENKYQKLYICPEDSTRKSVVITVTSRHIHCLKTMLFLPSDKMMN